jgi:type VI secretion system protein ImpL
VAKLRADAAALPQPFARMMDETGLDIQREIADSSLARTLARLREEITLTCQEKIASRYPFAKGADRDVDLDDFTRMFGPNGVIDQFVGAYVLAGADTSQQPWKWRDDNPLAKKLTPTSLADFALAADIRAAFFGADPGAPGFSYTVTPPAASGPRLEIDATLIAAGSGPTTVPWPGPAENHRTLLTLPPRSNGSAPLLLQSGVWSIYRMLDGARLSNDGAVATFSLGGQQFAYRFTGAPAAGAGGLKPLNLAELRAFHCPGGG